MKKYIDKYKYFIIKINTIEDSYVIQKFLFNIGIYWNLDQKDHIFEDENCYYYIELKNNRIIVNHRINESSIIFNKSDKKIYNINDFHKIEKIIKYGEIIPNYKPKKIERTI